MLSVRLGKLNGCLAHMSKYSPICVPALSPANVSVCAELSSLTESRLSYTKAFDLNLNFRTSLLVKRSLEGLQHLNILNQ